MGTWPYIAARPNPLTSLAIVIPDSLPTQQYRATRICVWRERTLPSSISCLLSSAPAHRLKEVRILTAASGRGAVANQEISCDPSPAPGQTRQTGSDSSENNWSAHGDSFRYGMHFRERVVC